MIYDMQKPSNNMLLSQTELNAMYQEQMKEIYNNDKNNIISENADMRERDRYIRESIQNIVDTNNKIISRSERLIKIKESFLSECILKLYRESLNFPMNNTDKIISKNLVNKFILENGAGNLINDFVHKHFILSEFSRICDKYYDKVLMESKCPKKPNNEECCNLENDLISKDTIDNFYKELEDIDVADAAKMIRDRVSDSVSEFIDTNAANKLEYEDIIKQAQDKAAAVNGDDALAESYLNIGKRKVRELKNSRMNNIFGYMVEALTKSVFKDENLKMRYINEGAVDMDGIVNSAQLIYTMLEMVNTMNMTNINAEYITNYLNNL